MLFSSRLMSVETQSLDLRTLLSSMVEMANDVDTTPTRCIPGYTGNSLEYFLVDILLIQSVSCIFATAASFLSVITSILITEL